MSLDPAKNLEPNSDPEKKTVNLDPDPSFLFTQKKSIKWNNMLWLFNFQRLIHPWIQIWKTINNNKSHGKYFLTNTTNCVKYN